MAPLTIPKSPFEVTKEWLEMVMKDTFSEVEVTKLEPLTEKDGFSCGVFKAEIKTGNKTEKLFIKVILPESDPASGFVLEYVVDQIEIEAYKTWLPKLVEFEKSKPNGVSDLQFIAPKFYSGDYCLDQGNRGFYIILSDISEEFQVSKSKQGLTFDQVKKVLEKMAKLHATSYAHGINHEIDYSQGILRSKLDRMVAKNLFHERLSKSLPLAKKDIINLDNDATKLVDHLDRLSRNCKEAYVDAFLNQDPRYLVHGDLWLYNIMFSSSSPQQCKIIDWQTLAADHPLQDFALFLFTSVNLADNEQLLDDAISFYQQSFECCCNDFAVECPFSLTEFGSMVRDKGFMKAVTFLLLFYDMICASEQFKPRFIWVLKMAVKSNPVYFQ